MIKLFNTPIYRVLIIFSLLFLVKIQFIFESTTLNHYDEVIIELISKLPVENLIEAIKSEPHPPGIYLLKKVFPSNVSDFVFIFLLSNILTLISLVLLHKFEWLKYKSVELGVILFIGSATFHKFTHFFKQDAITIPLILILSIILISKKYLSLHFQIIFSFALIGFIFCFGYIPFLISSLFFLIFLINNKNELIKNKKTLGILLLLTLTSLGLLLIYYQILGKFQIDLNSQRFYWLQETETGVYKSIMDFTTLYNSQSLRPELITLFFLLLLFWGVTEYADSKPQKKYLIYLLGILLIVVFNKIQIFSQTRYITPFYIIFCLIAGYGFSKKIKHIYIVVGLIIFYLFSGLLSFVELKSSQHGKVGDKFVSFLENTNKYDRVAIVSRNQVSSYVLKHIYFKNYPSTIPINIFNDEFNSYFFEDQISKYIMLSDTQINPNENDIKKILNKYNFKQVLFYRDKRASDTYDPENVIYLTLYKYCEIDDQISDETSQYILFKNCYNQ